MIIFDKDSIKNGDKLKGHSLVLFRSLYDEKTTPEIAHSPDNTINKLDQEGEIPKFYNSSDPDIVTFQRKLWRDFSDISRDPEKAKAMGVHVAQGQVVYRPFDPRFKYSVKLDATGEIQIEQVPRSPAEIRALDRHQQISDVPGQADPKAPANPDPAAHPATNPSAIR